MKKQICETIKIDWLFNIEFDELIVKLQEIKKEHPEASSIYFNQEFYGYDDGHDEEITIFRMETDEEELQRINEERRETARRKRLDRMRKEVEEKKVNKKIKDLEDEIKRLKKL